MVNIRSAALTHPGRKRPNNEDFITFFEPNDQEVLENSGCIYILADGVGGASKGEKASQYAAQKILHDYYNFTDISVTERLKTIIRQAGNDIFDFAQQQERFLQMATTVVVAVARQDQLWIAHVGDSRAYLIRDDTVTQLTRDHSTVGEMVRDGILTEEEAMHFEGRNPLSRSLGGQRDVQVDVTEAIPILPGDKVLLTSDGFSNYASRKTVYDLLQQGSPKEVVYRLIDYANQCGGSDNISVIIIEAISETVKPLLTPRGQNPQPVEWDSMPTLPQNAVYKNLQANSPKKKKRSILIAGALIAGLTVVFATMVFLVPIITENRSTDRSNVLLANQVTPTETEESIVQDDIMIDAYPAITPNDEDSSIIDPAEEEVVPVQPVDNGENIDVPEDFYQRLPLPANLPERQTDEPLGWCEFLYNNAKYNQDKNEIRDPDQPMHELCIDRHNQDISCVIMLYFQSLYQWIRDTWYSDYDYPLYLSFYTQEIIAPKGGYEYKSEDSFLEIDGEEVLFQFPHVTENECVQAGGKFHRYPEE